MAADVQIVEGNGVQASEVYTDKTGGTVRFKNADDFNVDAADPLIVPTSDREFSFEKFLRTNFNTAPDTQIDNLECYMDGSNDYGAGRKLWSRIIASYTTPAVPSEANDPPEIPVGGTPVAATDTFLLTSGSAGDLGVGPHTGTGQKGSYIDLVLEIEIGSASGTLSAETFTLRYDEI